MNAWSNHSTNKQSYAPAVNLFDDASTILKIHKFSSNRFPDFIFRKRNDTEHFFPSNAVDKHFCSNWAGSRRSLVLHVFRLFFYFGSHKKAILIYGTFENSSIALDSFWLEKGGIERRFRKRTFNTIWWWYKEMLWECCMVMFIQSQKVRL